MCWTASIIVVDCDSPCHKIKEKSKTVSVMIINTSINTTHFSPYIFTFLHFWFLHFWFLHFLDILILNILYAGGKARVCVWAISREIERITPVTTLWLHLINAAWATCLIVITSCTEYLRKCPKFQTGWRLTISHVVSSSFTSHLVSNRLSLFFFS